MKTTVIILGLLVLGFGIIQVYTMTSTNKTERQPFRLVEKNDNFEIRFYPSAIIVSVEKKGDYDAMSSAGFRDLAGYIFGGNEKSQKIAMTAPVIMEEQSESTKMSFVMPSDMKMEDLPVSNNQNLSFTETKPKYVAVISFGGFSNADKIKKHQSELRTILDQKNQAYDPQPIFMSYNPPYQMVGRTNEVAFELVDFEEK